MWLITPSVQMSPFGYINEVNLIGVGNCNNPFFDNSRYSPTRAFSGGRNGLGDKSAFGMHHYVRLEGTTSGATIATENQTILDVCALPITASGIDANTYNHADYLKKAVDMTLDILVDYGIKDIRPDGTIDAIDYNYNSSGAL